MELIGFIFFLFICLYLLLLCLKYVGDYLAKKKAAWRIKCEEKKRPPIICDECKQPNKKLGENTAKNIHVVGKARNICEDCWQRYNYCYRCGGKFSHTYSTYSGKNFCRTCFETMPKRDFSTTRQAVFQYYGHKCAICGDDTKLEVHHKTYRNEGRERFSDLVVLCRKHHLIQHKKIHTGPKGGKYYIKNRRKYYIPRGDDIYQLAAGDHSRKRR